MDKNETFDFFMDQLLGCAVEEFRATEESRLLHERLKQMDRECESMLMRDQHEFAQECFELIMEVDCAQEVYVYRKAFRDCTLLLKELGVLA